MTLLAEEKRTATLTARVSPSLLGGRFRHQPNFHGRPTRRALTRNLERIAGRME
jgi:hypothetical protein